MTQESMSAPVGDETRIAQLCEEISNRLRAGQSVDLEQYAVQWPQYAEELGKLLPAMQALVAFPTIELLGTEPSDDVDPQQPLGDFRIVRQIGHGGMGIVYEAVQLSLGRRVALKVLPFAAMLDERAQKRFRNEAMAAAALDHPHIVDVYGVGNDRGIHYYAMRLIEGRTLAEILDNLRLHADGNSDVGPVSLDALYHLPSSAGLNSTPSVAPPPSPRTTASHSTIDMANAVTRRTQRGLGRGYYRAIAQLGVDVADALQHAHEQGVIHRDIKPSNLMIDASGKTWVTDFGLAHVEANPSLTMTGDLIGTFRYMSPEQAAGQHAPVDHRTDIYSLGATLYELLTLSPLFPGESRVELLRQIMQVEPVPLRKLRGEIDVALETIVLKATAKIAADRYRTMRELAEDLSSYLNDQSIKAKPLGRVERVRRLVRRNSLALAGALVATLLMTAGLGTAFWMMHLARDDAMAKAVELERQGNELQKRNEQSTLILGRINRTVSNMLERLSSLPVGDAIRQKITEEELAFYEELARIDRQTPAAQSQLALSLHRLGHLQIDQTKFGEAETTLKRSIDILSELAAADPNSIPVLTALAHAWMNYGRAALYQDHLDSALERMQKSIEHADAAFSRSPNDPECRLALAFPWGQMGVIQRLRGYTSESIRAHHREIELHTANVQAHPENFGYRTVLGSAYMICGESQCAFKDLNNAKRSYSQALAVFRQLESERPDDALIHSRIAHSALGVYQCTERSAEDLEMILSELEAVVVDPPRLRPEYKHLAARLACFPADLTRRERAVGLALAQQCVDAQPEHALYWNTLGVAQLRNDKWTDCLKSLDHASQLGGVKYSHDDFVRAICHHMLGHKEDAEQCFRRAQKYMTDSRSTSPLLLQFSREAAQQIGIEE